ncbi:MAG TPA: diguanylate cyclase [Solirubrobacteraceae bacterium]|nr:diguanylate cyclase [Solirubrobacteraceae bacterium]
MSISDGQAISELSEAELALSVLRTTQAASTLVFDRALRYVFAAGDALAHHLRDVDQLEGRYAAEALLPDRWSTFEPLYRAALDGESRGVQIWSPDNTRCDLVEVEPLRDSGDAIIGGMAVSRDITPRKQAERAGHQAQEHFERVFEQAPIGMALLAPSGRWIRVNSALLTITGYESDDLLAKTLAEVTHPDDLSADQDDARKLLSGEIREYRMEKRYFHAEGHVISTMLSVSLVRDEHGHPLNFIAQIEDITERKQMEERLRHLADHDPLTGLRNRRLFERDLRMQVGRCRRYGEQAALLVIDLDGFKQVNDVYGHKVGDDLLKSVSMALEQRLRGTDLVARLGGDEFAVLLCHTDWEAATTVAEDLRKLIAACSVMAAGKRICTAASVGVARIDVNVVSDEAVLIDADRAMYTAKQAHYSLALERM